ncbi:MAG: HEPN domain-containing protein [Dehalococcoidia bacterium]|nr:HEPN domain-containing protein [Dehalococcoidia bacterium]
MTSDERVRAYLEAADESLSAVEVLVAAGFNRIAVSRLYYVAFYTASALLADRGLAFRRHRAVISQYALAFARTGILDPDFAGLLHELLLARHEVDYAMAPPAPETYVAALLGRCRLFLAAAETYLAAEPNP